jgi:hypothetical protein
MKALGKATGVRAAIPVAQAARATGSGEGRVAMASRSLKDQAKKVSSMILQRAQPILERAKPYLLAAGIVLDAALLANALHTDLVNGDTKLRATKKMVANLLGSHLGTLIGATIGNCIFPGVGAFIGGVLGGLAGWKAGDSLAEWIIGKEPPSTQAIKNVYIFANQAGPDRWWIHCLYHDENNEVRQRECQNKKDELWDIYPDLNNPNHKIIKPAYDTDKTNHLSLCLTAPVANADSRSYDHRVFLSPCTSSPGKTEYQKWHWWVNTAENEEWAKNVGISTFYQEQVSCLDASYGDEGALVWPCKTVWDSDRQNQLWQFGPSPNHN